MSLAPAQRERLAEHHHIARHCRARDIANGMPRENAFRLRPGEEYLSTNWLEYFHDSDRQSQIAGVRAKPSVIRQAIWQTKAFAVSRTGVFAVLNVGAAVSACKMGRNLDVAIVALGEAHDPSHTGIFGYTEHDTDIAALLAASVRLDEVHPAIA